MPEEMDETTSGSEVTDEYSSKSEGNESSARELNVQSISDGNGISYLTQASKDELHQEGASSSAPTQNPNPDALFDRGLLKSPPGTSRCVPPSVQLRNPEGLETDTFDEAVITPSLGGNIHKLHMKKSGTKEKFSSALVSLPKERPQTPDPNRINELDRFRQKVNLTKTIKTLMNNQLKPQNEFKESPLKDLSPVAGTSGSWRKYRKPNRDKKTQDNQEPSDPSPLDDVKSLTNCIIQNSLNKIEVKEDGQSELIENLSPLHGGTDAAPSSEPKPQESLQQAVQNSNLVNNNEGLPTIHHSDLKNMPASGINMPVNGAADLDIDESIDLLNDNLEDLVPLLADNLITMENVNGATNEVRHEPAEEKENPRPSQDVLEINDEIISSIIEGNLVARASREVLYDENSEQDLLEDFEFPLPTDQDNIFGILDLDANGVLVSNRSVNSDSPTSRVNTIACASHGNRGNFPHWLLQILGTSAMSEEPYFQPSTRHDETYFYCQGDGLGIHPSGTSAEVDEAVDIDRDSTTEETSSNNTVEYTEENPGSLQEESSLDALPVEGNISRPVERPVRTRADLLSSDDSFGPPSNELELIDEGIRATQVEVHRRSQVGLQEEDSQGNSFTADNDTCSLSWEYSSTTFASAQSSTTDEHSLESRYQENSATSEERLDVENFDHTDSFNDPENSRYFDSRTEEF